MSTNKEAWAGAVSNRKELHRSKRDAILRMAARMFANEGYAGTSLAAIAERLNVSKPTLYYYVENKEDILNTCVERGIAAVNENLATAHAQGVNGYEKLAVFFGLHVDFILDDFGILLVAARQDLTSEHRKRLKIVDDAVTGLITEGIADSSIKSCDAKLACFALFGVFNAIPTWFHDDGGLAREEVVSAYFEMLSGGFAHA